MLFSNSSTASSSVPIGHARPMKRIFFRITSCWQNLKLSESLFPWQYTSTIFPKPCQFYQYLNCKLVPLGNQPLGSAVEVAAACEQIRTGNAGLQQFRTISAAANWFFNWLNPHPLHGLPGKLKGFLAVQLRLPSCSDSRLPLAGESFQGQSLSLPAGFPQASFSLPDLHG